MQKKNRPRTAPPSLPHIVALGGSVIAPDGVDISFIKNFRSLIRRLAGRGHKFIIVIGGGALAREYQRIATTLASDAPTIELDTIGMRATQLNAELVRLSFGKRVHPEIVNAPEKLLHLRDPIAIAAGWMPGYSTDTVAMRIAEELGAKRVIIAGRPAFVYDRDFVRHPGAKPLRKLNWNAYRKLISKRWKPGMGAPVDPVAARRAERAGLEALVVRGTHLDNLANVFLNRPFRGTTIRG